MTSVKLRFDDMHELVTHLLANDEAARNNDWRLIVLVLEHKGYARKLDGGYSLVFLEKDFAVLPSAETIRRVCQEIQNTHGKHIPTLPAVLQQRGFREKAIKNYYGEQSEELRRYREYIYGVNVV